MISKHKDSSVFRRISDKIIFISSKEHGINTFFMQIIVFYQKKVIEMIFEFFKNLEIPI